MSHILWKVSHSVVSDSLRPHRLYSPWNSPGQNTGVGSLSLLQGIFPIQGSNPGLSHCGQILSQLSHRVSPGILDWVVYPFSSGPSQPGIELWSPALQADSLPTELPGKPKCCRNSKVSLFWLKWLRWRGQKCNEATKYLRKWVTVRTWALKTYEERYNMLSCTFKNYCAAFLRKDYGKGERIKNRNVRRLLQ